MSDKPISDLRRRMIADMTVRSVSATEHLHRATSARSPGTAALREGVPGAMQEIVSAYEGVPWVPLARRASSDGPSRAQESVGNISTLRRLRGAGSPLT